MKGLIVLTSLLLLAVSVFGKGQQENYVRNEVLVKLDAGSRASALRSLELGGAALAEEFGDLGWVRLRLPEWKSVEDAMGEFIKLSGVSIVQPNFYYRLLATPNDPEWGSTGMYGLPIISAPQAWDLTTGSSEVVVANIDTGMRLTHEDLAANIWTNPGEIPNNGIDDDGNGFIDDYYGWDFRFDDNDPADQHGHGTHTGGTIGAVGNNAVGVVGVNWNVRLMTIKIYSAAAGDTTSAMLINAYNYVRMMKERGINIRVTNNSYGGCAEACGYDQATKDAIDALGDAGILNVFAAGNAGQNTEVFPFYPGSYTSPSILNVAASNSLDNRAGFSNFGVISVDLAAPGAAILSTTNGSNSSYGGNSGTSMATPHVSGAAALLAAHNPKLSAASLKATLMNTVDPLSQWNGIVKTGGRLNVFNALQSQTVCDFKPSTTAISVPTKGGYVSVDVNAAPNCDFSVSSLDRWIKIDGPESRSGKGTVTFRILFNTTVGRQGTVKIGGHDVIVSQVRGQKF